jgi:uncharacterized protein YfaS (alpha-2-macroglobulin family)
MPTSKSTPKPIVSSPPLPEPKPKKDLIFVLCLILLPIILASIAALAFRLYKLNAQYEGIVSLPQYFEVLGITPSGRTAEVNTDITMQFNMPVEAHHIEHSINFYPYIEGQFKNGKSANEVIFDPAQPLPPGLYLSIVFRAGLPSENGKKLTQDQTFNLSTPQDVNTISFTKDGWAGKFMSFPTISGAKLTLTVGGNVSKPKVKVYRATKDLLINSLLYVQNQDQIPYYYPYGSYLDNPTDTSKLEILREINEPKDQSELELKEKTGIYLIQGLSDDKVISTAWITLNEVGIHFRQDDEKIFLAAQNLATNQAESGIDVSFYSVRDKATVLENRSLSGIQDYPFDFTKKLDFVLAQKGNDTLLVPVMLPNTQADIRLRENLAQKHQLFIYTDRPIYKKGAKVSFRGIARVDNDALYEIPGGPLKLRVYIPNYSAREAGTYIDQIVETDSAGVFSGEFILPEGMNPSNYSLFVTANLAQKPEYSSTYAYFDVFEYTKPAYGLEVTADKNEYTKPDEIIADIKGTYFDGKPLSDIEVNVSFFSKDFYETEKSVYNSSFNLNSWGGMCGGGIGYSDEYYGSKIGDSKVVKLDSNGMGKITLKTQELKSPLSQEVSVVAEKTDDNKNNIIGARNVIVHQGEYNVFFRPGPNKAYVGTPVTQVFYAETKDGQKLSQKEFTYEFMSETWSSQEKKTITSSLDKGSITTDGNGLGTITKSLKTDNLNNQNISLVITGMDSRGNSIESKKYIYFYPTTQTTYNRGFGSSSADQIYLKVISTTANLIPGTTAQLEIESPKDLTVFATFERGRVYNPRWLDLKKGKNTYEFVVPDYFAPSITPTFSFFVDGNHYFEGLSLNVPALSKLISVEIETDKPQYSIGDTALVTIITKNANGAPIEASVGVGVVDKAIFALRKNATPALHSSFYYFRPRSTNSSSSLTWISNFGEGGGGGGGGFDLYQKDTDTLYWNPNLKTGPDGKVTIPVPVGSLETTWKILTYASTDNTELGQGELDILVSK